MKPNDVVDQTYATARLPALRTQPAKADIRLAAVVNQALGI